MKPLPMEAHSRREKASGLHLAWHYECSGVSVWWMCVLGWLSFLVFLLFSLVYHPFDRNAQEGRGRGRSEFCTVGHFCCFCMFNIDVPVDPWEIMAFRYAHDL